MQTKMQKPEMVAYIPEGQKGVAQISHFEVSESDAKFHNLRCAISGERGQNIQSGKYVKLTVNGALMMSDTAMEWRTNRHIIEQANGDVLIAGLGIGMILVPMLAKPEVKSVTVIEKYQDVADLVLPAFQEKLPKKHFEKLKVIVSDIHDWKPAKGQTWDVVYFDIWADQSTDDLKTMTKFKRGYAKRVRRENPNHLLACWREDEVRDRVLRERRWRMGY